MPGYVKRSASGFCGSSSDSSSAYTHRQSACDHHAVPPRPVRCPPVLLFTPFVPPHRFRVGSELDAVPRFVSPLSLSLSHFQRTSLFFPLPPQLMPVFVACSIPESLLTCLQCSRVAGIGTCPACVHCIRASPIPSSPPVSSRLLVLPYPLLSRALHPCHSLRCTVGADVRLLPVPLSTDQHF